jgi:hypothetical protein
LIVHHDLKVSLKPIYCEFDVFRAPVEPFVDMQLGFFCLLNKELIGLSQGCLQSELFINRLGGAKHSEVKLSVGRLGFNSHYKHATILE